MKLGSYALTGHLFVPALTVSLLWAAVAYFYSKRHPSGQTDTEGPQEDFEIVDTKSEKKQKKKHKCSCGPKESTVPVNNVQILYGTSSSRGKELAEILQGLVEYGGTTAAVADLKDCDPKETLLHEESSSSVCIILVSTDDGGNPPEDARGFYKWLEEAMKDLTLSKTLLQDGSRFAVFEVNESLHSDNGSKVGRDIDQWLHKLGAKRFLPLRLGNENTTKSHDSGTGDSFDLWCRELVKLLKKGKPCAKGNNCCSKKKNKSDERTEGACDSHSDSDGETHVLDLEDLVRDVRFETPKKKI